jgi:hypothetical protein
MKKELTDYPTYGMKINKYGQRESVFCFTPVSDDSGINQDKLDEYRNSLKHWQVLHHVKK